MQELQTAYAWQEALELSKRLVHICEEFSDSDTNVIVWHLRQAIVDVPAGVAADLEAGEDASMGSVVRLMTSLELVRKIYPAIDTAAADEQLDKLVARMKSDTFAEREPDPEVEEDAEQPEPATPAVSSNPEAGLTAEPAPTPAGGTVVTPPDKKTKPVITSIDITGSETKEN